MQIFYHNIQILCEQPRNHSVNHIIVTNGLSVSTEPKRMSPVKLKSAKMEFKKMMDLGICHPPSSYGCRSLHMVKKKMVIGVRVVIINR